MTSFAQAFSVEQENELKFLVDGSISDLQKHLAIGAEGPIEITQRYINNDTRLRRMVSAEGTNLLFSFKKRVRDGRNREVNVPLDPETFEALWETGTVEGFKVRYKILHGDVTWDVDFYQDGEGETYIVLAEAEMPSNMEHPGAPPDALSAIRLIEIPREDGRFTARKLADIDYALAVKDAALSVRVNAPGY